MSKKAKSPFVTYTVDQIFTSESMLYSIRVGQNVFESKDGQTFFPAKGANRIYNKIVNDLLDKIYHGTIKEQKISKKLLAFVRIEPLRMH